MATAEFSKFGGILSAALSQHHLSGFEIAQLEFILLNIGYRPCVGPITSWEIDGETVSDFIFWGAPKSLQMVTAAMKLKGAYSLEGKPW